ncbi:MAG: GNAT family N-acetyltransferase [Acidobacteriota bacterium]
MVAYRFCRPDDIPYLIRATNECCNIHLPDHPPMTLADFHSEVRELNVWPSNCMVASAVSEPIAVCIATKRKKEVLIHRVATHPDHLRQGHGRHILNSLSQKLAVLGPSRLIAQVPADRLDLCRFFEAAGYQKEITYHDFRLESPLPPLDSPDLIIPITVDELLDNQVLNEDETDRSWERQTATLINRKDQLKGLALASPDQIEAFVLHRHNEKEGTREIVALSAQTTFLPLLLRHFCRREMIPLVIPKLSPQEISFSFLESLGFQRGDEYIRYANTAKPL